MRSRIDIYDTPRIPEYAWDKYSVDQGYTYTWDKYQYTIPQTWDFIALPTTVTDQDYKCYLKYDLQYMENCYAKMYRTTPTSVSYILNIYRGEGVEPTKQYRTDVPYDVFLENDAQYIDLYESIKGAGWEMVEGDKYITDLTFKAPSLSAEIGAMNYIKDYSLFTPERRVLGYNRRIFNPDNYKFKGKTYLETGGKINDVWDCDFLAYDPVTNVYKPDYSRDLSRKDLSDDFYLMKYVTWELPLDTVPNPPSTMEEAKDWVWPDNILDLIGDAPIDMKPYSGQYGVYNGLMDEYSVTRWPDGSETRQRYVNTLNSPATEIRFGADIYVKSATGTNFYFVNSTRSGANYDTNIQPDGSSGLYMPENFVCFGRKPNEKALVYPVEVNFGGSSSYTDYHFTYIEVKAAVFVPVRFVAYKDRLRSWDRASDWKYTVNFTDDIDKPLMTTVLNYYTSDGSETGTIPNVTGYARVGEPEFKVYKSKDDQPVEKNYMTLEEYVRVAIAVKGTPVPFLPRVYIETKQDRVGSQRTYTVTRSSFSGIQEMLFGLMYGYMQPSDYKSGYVTNAGVNYYYWVPSMTKTLFQSEESQSAYPNNNMSNSQYYVPLPVVGSTYSTSPLNLTDFTTQESGKDNYRAWTFYNGIGQGKPRLTNKVGSEITYSNIYPDGEPYYGFIYKLVSRTVSKYIRSQYPIDTVTSLKDDEYPKNNVVEEDGKLYWYIYKGIRDRVITRWGPTQLLTVPNFTQSAGSASSFAIGTVAGASFNVEVLKPLVQVLPYIDHKVKLLYTFADNQYKYYEEGIFYLREAKENGQKKSTVTAYDNCYKLDCAAAPLIKQINYPITAKELFLITCAYCDIPYTPDISFLNDEQFITEEFGSETTTCRDVMEWIAQIAGTIIIADYDGKLIFKDLNRPDRSRGSIASNTYDLDSSMIPIQKPNAIQYKYENEDVLIYNQSTTKPKILNFNDNPFCKNKSKDVIDAMLQRTISNIDALGTIYAWTVTVPTDVYGMNCGDSWVVSSSDIESRRGIITEKRINSSGVTYVSSGEIMALSADKSLETEEITELIDNMSLLFHSYTINKIVLKDNVFKETYRTIDTVYTFKQGNFIYNYNDLVFDLTTQFEYLYAEQKNVKVVVNGTPCYLTFVDETLEIVNPAYVNPKLSDITTIQRVENGTVTNTYNGIDAWKKSALPPSAVDPEIIVYPNQYVNDGLYELYYYYLRENNTDYGLLPLIYLLLDGEWHDAKIVSETFDYQRVNLKLPGEAANRPLRMYANCDFTGLQKIRFKYNQTTKTLSYELIYQMAQQFTIDKVILPSGKELSLRNSSGSIDLPITATSLNCSVYEDDKLIGELFSSPYGLRKFEFTPAKYWARSTNIAAAPDVYYFSTPEALYGVDGTLSGTTLTINAETVPVIWDVVTRQNGSNVSYTWSGYSRPKAEPQWNYVQIFDGTGYISKTDSPIYPDGKVYYLYNFKGTLLATIQLTSEGLKLTEKSPLLLRHTYDRGLLILTYYGG